MKWQLLSTCGHISYLRYQYLMLAVRIQLFNANDPDEIALVNNLQDQFVIQANSADPFPAPRWDQQSLNALRTAYLQEFATIRQYPADWQGPRGAVDEETRHLAAAGAWGLFPQKDAIYINDNPSRPADTCSGATYQVPENNAFWSITVYSEDGYMKSSNNIINAANAVMNEDGTLTVHFGSLEHCGNIPNRLDVSEGWNFIMRIYRPGPSVLDGTYRLPEVIPDHH